MNQRKSSTLPQIFDTPHQQAIGDLFEGWVDDDFWIDDEMSLDPYIRPNPPTPEAVKKAQFVDKTYKWSGR